MSKDVYANVTDSIIEALENGNVPWHKPWKDVGGKPTSLATGKPYRGINVFLLMVTAMSKGYTSPYWATFKQVRDRGGSVRKGQKGTQVILWKPVKAKEAKPGEDQKGDYLLLRHFYVFNADQCDGIELPESEPLADHDPIVTAQEIADRFIGALNGPQLGHGGDRAFYSPARDHVQMPLLGAFESAEAYHSTLFHELAHSTGHASRLARTSLVEPAPFGTPDYSREELVAEMASAFLCGEAGIEVNVAQHAGYIASWLKALQDDKKLIVQAAAAAQKATDAVLGTTKEEASSDASPRSDHTQGGNHESHKREHDRRQWHAGTEHRAAFHRADRRREASLPRAGERKSRRPVHVAPRDRSRSERDPQAYARRIHGSTQHPRVTRGSVR